MHEAIISDALETTFHDYRLTRGERQGLTRLLEEHASHQTARDFIRSESFRLATAAIVDASTMDQPMIMDWLEQITKLLVHLERESTAVKARNEAFFSPRDNCVHRIGQLLANAKRTIDICVFTITDDRIRREILDTHQRGVSVRVLSDDDKSGDRGSDVHFLKEKGVDVCFDQSSYHMHHKFAIFDQRTLLTGSYNWTRSAAEHNEENFLITRDKESCTAFQKEFDRLWKMYR